MLIFTKKLFDKETKMSLIELNNLFTDLKAEEIFEINGGGCVCGQCAACVTNAQIAFVMISPPPRWPPGGGC